MFRTVFVFRHRGVFFRLFSIEIYVLPLFIRIDLIADLRQIPVIRLTVINVFRGCPVLFVVPKFICVCFLQIVCLVCHHDFLLTPAAAGFKCR